MYLLPSLRFLFARAIKRPSNTPILQKHRQVYSTILNHFQNNKLFEVNELMAQLDNDVDRYNPDEYTRYLNNKPIVQFLLRKYGYVNLAIKNTLLFSKDSFASQNIIHSYIQLISLQFLYQRQNQGKTSELLNNLLHKIKNTTQRLQAKYLVAMSSINQGNVEDGIDRLIDFINQQNEVKIPQQDKEIINEYTQMAFISILTARIMYFSSEDNSSDIDEDNMAIKVTKNYINNKKIEKHEFNNSNPTIIYQKYNQYSEDFPEETKYYKQHVIKLDSLIGERLFSNKQWVSMYRQLEKVQGTIFEHWIKGQKYVQQGQFTEAIEEFKKTAESNEISPEYDILKYEAMNYIGKIEQKNQTEGFEDSIMEAEEFKVSAFVEQNTQHLPYMLIPFQQVFGIHNIVA